MTRVPPATAAPLPVRSCSIVARGCLRGHPGCASTARAGPRGHLVRVAPVSVQEVDLPDQGPRLARGGGDGAGHRRGRGRRGRGALPRRRRVTPEDRARCGSIPSATALEARARRGPHYEKALAELRPGRGRPGAPRSSCRAEQLVAAEELNRSRGENAAARRGGRGEQAPRWDRASRTQHAPRCGRPAAGVDQHAQRGDRAVREARRRARHPRGHEPPAPALQGLGRRVAPRAPERRPSASGSSALGPPGLPGAHLPRGRGGRPRDPAGRGPGLGQEPRRAEARLLRRGDPRHRRAARAPWWCPRAPSRPASGASWPMSWTRARRSCARSQIGLRTGTGVVEILSGVKAGETVVIEGSDRLADGIDVQAVDRHRRAKLALAGADPMRQAEPRRKKRTSEEDRHGDDPGRHLDPQPRLRLDADVRPHRLRPDLLHRGRQRLQGPGDQPEPRRRLPGGQRRP